MKKVIYAVSVLCAVIAALYIYNIVRQKKEPSRPPVGTPQASSPAGQSALGSSFPLPENPEEFFSQGAADKKTPDSAGQNAYSSGLQADANKIQSGAASFGQPGGGISVSETGSEGAYKDSKPEDSADFKQGYPEGTKSTKTGGKDSKTSARSTASSSRKSQRNSSYQDFFGKTSGGSMPDLSGMPAGMSQADINSIMALAKKSGAVASGMAQKLRNMRAQADRQLEGAMAKAASAPFQAPQPEQKQLARGKVWPVTGKISQNFGGVNWNIYPGRTYQGKYYPHFHNGLDIAAPRGTPIRAYDAGQVTFVGMSGGYGMHVVVSHPGGLSTSYSHMDTGGRGPTVRKGDYVSAGEKLGYIGMTGMTTGPHIHFMVRDQRDVRNPRNVLP